MKCEICMVVGLCEVIDKLEKLEQLISKLLPGSETLVSIPEVLKELNISRATYNNIRHTLPLVRVGGRDRMRREDVEKLKTHRL